MRKLEENGRRTVAGAIIYRISKHKLEILLVHQADKEKNIWSIPKGGADHGESAEAAARREVLEETNIATTALEFLGYVDYGKSNKRLYCYMGRCPTNAKLQVGLPEIDNAGFFEVTRAKKMVDKRQRPMLNALQKIIMFSRRAPVTV
jgi:predicted NUDIX family NTP pyrophosphohydrolase